MVKTFKQYLTESKRTFTRDQAEEIGASLGIDFNKIDIEQFRMGLEVESEHDMGDETDTVSNDRDLGKIAWTHLKELPDYYDRLKKMESDDIQEKLVMYNNGAKNGQCVFVIGGGASGKSFAVNKFIDSFSFKIVNVDDLKDTFIKWNKQSKKYPEWLDYNSKDPEQVSKLHQFVSDKTWDKAVQTAALYANQSSGLKNIMFDTALSKIGSLQKKIDLALEAGYHPRNIHITWVLANYNIAIVQNQARDRVVPSDILLSAHENSALVMDAILHNKLPSGVDGSVTVVLNNPDKTITYREQFLRTPTGKLIQKRSKETGELEFDKEGNPIWKMEKPIKSFTYATLKYPGRAIMALNDKQIELKTTVYKWMLENCPESLLIPKKLSGMPRK